MRKKRVSNSVADEIATFIGKSMGELLNQKESLQRQLTDVERQIAGVKARVLKQFGTPARARRKAKGAVNRAVKAARRQLSPATRRKMAQAAKRRWARVRQAAKVATS